MMVEQHQPDVVVMDLAMPILNGIEAARQICNSNSQSSIVFLSMHSDEGYVLKALKSGAKGFLLKDSAEHDLINAVKTVSEGKAFFSPAISKMLVVKTTSASSRCTTLAEGRGQQQLRSVHDPGKGGIAAPGRGQEQQRGRWTPPCPGPRHCPDGSWFCGAKFTLQSLGEIAAATQSARVSLLRPPWASSLFLRQMQGRPSGFAVLLCEGQRTDPGAFEWPRENVEAAVLHQLVPQVRVGDIRKENQTTVRGGIRKRGNRAPPVKT